MGGRIVTELNRKFSRIEGGDSLPHDYGNLFFEEPCGGSTRLVIGPTAHHIDLLIDLATQFEDGPWYVLYVLLVPRLGQRSPGRYQSPPFETHAELAAFLSSFKPYCEGDGRHHVWVGSASNGGLLVYDHHDVIFAYGPIGRFKELLSNRGFREASFWFPAPHSHGYLAENDSEEERIMAELPWQHFPLQPGDAWD